MPPLRRVCVFVLLGPCLMRPLPAHGASESPRNPAGGSGTATLERVPDARPPAPPPRTRRVYACTTASQVEFSDRPCSADAQLWEIDLPAASAAATGRAPQATAAARARGPDAGAAAHERTDAEDGLAAREAACRRLEQAVRELDERMRAGYSAREAGRLWARWREARERLREARC